MNIDMEHFTPWLSLYGGVLIGLAALLLMAFNGRVMGVSGILSAIFDWRSTWNERSWRVAFITGAIIMPWLLVRFTGFEPLMRPVVNGVTLAIAAFLVGLGTAIGSGCTSGHGICGLARFSKRSLVAVLIFMATAMMTVFITRYLGIGR